MLEDRKKDGHTAVGLASREKRTHPRYPFSAGAKVTDATSGATLNARISDIGRGGCYVDTISPFTVGAELKLLISKEAHSFAAEAKVVYSAVGMGMGVMFTGIEPEQRWTLEKWLAELRGEPAAERDVQQPKNGHPAHPSETPKDTSSEASAEPSYVLNELIITLMRKRVLTDAEGKALLQKLLQ
jgi:hypothetical protein